MEKIDEIKLLCQEENCACLEGESLSKHTTFRIGGPCKLWVEISSLTGLQKLISFCSAQGISYVVMGNGSNILASDQGYDGVIFHIGKAYSAITVDGTKVVAQGGATLGKIGRLAIEERLSGMERLTGIPGTIAGGLFMNAGAYGAELKDVVTKAICVDQTGVVQKIAVSDMELGYRQSIFQKNGWIVAEVELELQTGEYGAIHDETEEYLKKRRAKQPLELPSAGSTFKRPEGSYASMLIDQCGLKGASVGDAQVSVKHAGFVVNNGSATCQDVLELCRFVQETVQEKTGYVLELEPIILGK